MQEPLEAPEEQQAGEEHQRHTLHLNPINLDPSATAQPKNNPLPVYILPVAQFTPEAHAPKAESIPFALPVQYFKKLVAFVQTFATTSKKMAPADVAWHSGWFGCWFGFGAPEPRHIHKLHQFPQPQKGRKTGLGEAQSPPPFVFISLALF